MINREQMKPHVRKFIRDCMEMEKRLITDEEMDVIIHQTGLIDVLAYTIMACDLKAELNATPLTK